MRKIKIIAILTMLSFFSVSYASAQATDSGGSSPITLATVDIYRTKIISQKDNNLTIDFDISNGAGVQPGVKYSVVLMRGDINSQIMADQKVYGETLVLGPNTTVHKEIIYTAPSYLKGDFSVWVMSDNDRGLPLGQGLAGKITLNGSGQSVEILPSSCFLKIDGQANKKYTLAQGVDVAPTENLILVCNVQNNFPNAATVTPNFNTFYRVAFGDLIASAKQASFSMAAGQKETMEFPIPKVSKPQAYDVTLSLLDNNGTEISNELTAHYVLQGDSATIQNLGLDKNSYASGDIANVTFSWTPRADWFSGSRELQAQPPTSIPPNDVVVLTITSNSTACSDVYKQELSYDSMVNVGLKVPVKIDCPNPQVSFSLEDSSGNVLDREAFNLNNNPGLNNKVPSQPASANGNSMEKVALILVAVLLVISLVLVAVRKKKRNSLSVFLALIIFSGAVFSFGTRPAQARSFTSYTGCSLTMTIMGGGWKLITVASGWTDGVYDVGLDNDVYNPGASMLISGRTQGMPTCSNGDQNSGVIGAFDRVMPQGGGGDFLLFHYVQNGGGQTSGNLNTAASSTPGYHYVSFIGGTWDPNATPHSVSCGGSGTFGWDYRDHFEIGYTVLASPPPPQVCTPGTFDPVRCRVCDNGVWEADCVNYGSGTPLSDWCGCEKQCTGTNANPECIATCGPAATAYAAGSTGFSGAFCNQGRGNPSIVSPPNPVFPTTANPIVSWVCLDQDRGADSSTCTASLSAPVCTPSSSYQCLLTGSATCTDQTCGTTITSKSYGCFKVDTCPSATTPAANPALCVPNCSNSNQKITCPACSDPWKEVPSQ